MWSFPSYYHSSGDLLLPCEPGVRFRASHRSVRDRALKLVVVHLMHMGDPRLFNFLSASNP